MANAKKENLNTKSFSALYSKHAELYEMPYEDSKKIVNSVLDSIAKVLETCDVLTLSEFGKFVNVERKARLMVDNLPGSDGKTRVVPAKHVVKFTAFPKLNESSDIYYKKRGPEGGED